MPDPEAIASIGSRTDGLTILAFIGTWCPDSVRQVPRFLWLLDQVGIELGQCALIGLDRAKRDRAGLAQQHAIERVPTFVVMRGDRELGRITESPIDTLDRDLARILAESES